MNENGDDWDDYTEQVVIVNGSFQTLNNGRIATRRE
jgi:hypothetical protein